jgi:hypothetical protein
MSENLLINVLHDEIDVARVNEAQSTTLAGAYYWKGYRQALERALTLVLREERKHLLAAKDKRC